MRSLIPELYFVILGLVVILFILVTVLQGRKRIKENKLRNKLNDMGFDISKEVCHNDFIIFLDEKNKKWALKYDKNYEPKSYDYKDLKDAEVIADQKSRGFVSAVDKLLTDRLVTGEAFTSYVDGGDEDGNRTDIRKRMKTLQVKLVLDEKVNAMIPPLDILSDFIKDNVKYTLAINKGKHIVSVFKKILDDNAGIK